jgi:hypothetical protein
MRARVAEHGPMPDRPRPCRRLAPRRGPKPGPIPGPILAAEPGRIDPGPGVEPGNENGLHPGLCLGGSPAPLPVLRAPAAVVARPSAPRGRGGPGQLRPMPVPPRSRRARQEASAGPATPVGRDRPPAVRKIALRVVRKDLRRLMEPIVCQVPIGRTKHAVDKGAVDKHAEGVVDLRWEAGPGGVHCALGQPDSTLPDLTLPGPPVRNGHSRERQDPGRPPQGPLAVMPIQNQMPGEPITPGRGQSLAPAEAKKAAATADHGRPLSPGLNPGHGPAGLQQNQGKQNQGT